MRNACTSAQMLELAAKGDHPWQQCEFIEAQTNQTSERLRELAAKGELGITWTADVDEAMMRMIMDGVSYKKIASELGNGLKTNDIKNRCTRHLKKSSGIIKPAVKRGSESCITWAADDDEAIVRMKKDGVTYANIASELGNGLKTNDIINRWSRHLKVECP